MENTCSFENSDEDNTFELDIKDYQISKKFVKNVKENFFNTSLKYIFNTAISFFFINCGIIAFILKKTKVEKIQYSRSMLEFLIKSRFS